MKMFAEQQSSSKHAQTNDANCQYGTPGRACQTYALRLNAMLLLMFAERIDFRINAKMFF
jgi:hypothetical protein